MLRQIAVYFILGCTVVYMVIIFYVIFNDATTG
jgi:hypothetical protein